jgi:hypothetical protein
MSSATCDYAEMEQLLNSTHCVATAKVRLAFRLLLLKRLLLSCTLALEYECPLVSLWKETTGLWAKRSL